jgi:hypothetical protein
MTRRECGAMNIAATELDRFTQNRLNARDRLQLHVSVPGLPGRREARETPRPTRGGGGDGRRGDGIGEFGAMNLCATVRHT